MKHPILKVDKRKFSSRPPDEPGDWIMYAVATGALWPVTVFKRKGGGLAWRGYGRPWVQSELFARDAALWRWAGPIVIPDRKKK